MDSTMNNPRFAEHRWARFDEAHALVDEALRGVLAGIERHARA